MTSQSGTLNGEEDTVVVTLPSEEDPSIGASVPPVLGLLLLDEEGDKTLFPGSLPSNVHGVVFGEDDEVVSTINTSISDESPPPSVVVTSHVNSSGDIPLKLTSLRRVSVLPVDTDKDGNPDAVVLGVFVDDEEDPVSIYVISVDDSSKIPEEGSQADVSVSEEGTSGEALQLDLDKASPLGKLFEQQYLCRLVP